MKHSSDLYKQVYSVLKHYPETRNSDIALMIKLWNVFYPDNIFIDHEKFDYVRVKDLYQLPREDHIKRYRAEIQNVRGIFLPTNIDILMERIKLSKEWRERLGYAPDWSDAFIKKKVQEYLERNNQLNLI